MKHRYSIKRKLKVRSHKRRTTIHKRRRTTHKRRRMSHRKQRGGQTDAEKQRILSHNECLSTLSKMGAVSEKARKSLEGCKDEVSRQVGWFA